MKPKQISPFLFALVLFLQTSAQIKSVMDFKDSPVINPQTLALSKLIEDIRRAVYESEEELADCLPPFTKTSITLEGTNESEGGFELNLVFFKINAKKKKGRTDRTVITFEKDTVLSELDLSPPDGRDLNFKILKSHIVSSAYSNCLLNDPYRIAGDGILDLKESELDGEDGTVLTERFKTSKLEIEISFYVEKELGTSGEFKITPISGSLSGSLRRKHIQTVNVIFGKD